MRPALVLPFTCLARPTIRAPWQTEHCMFVPLVLAASRLDAPAQYAAPEMWALGMASAPRLGFVGDVAGDGHADLISLNPRGECSIDVCLTIDNDKPGNPSNAIEHWGKDCQAATVGEIDDEPVHPRDLES